MTVQQNQSLKHKTTSGNGKKTTSGQLSKQIVRIIYSDPDATDSSDDEGDPRSSFKRLDENGVKRMVVEICISNCSNIDGNKGKKDIPNTEKASTSGRSSSQFKGVRKRQWGKYACEIRNPFLVNKREWLGTYSNELEAHFAYEKRKLEIDALLELQQENPSAAAPLIADMLAVERSIKNKRDRSTIKKRKNALLALTKENPSVVSTSAVATSIAGTSAVCALAAVTPADAISAVPQLSTSEDENVGNQASPSSVLDVSDPTGLIKAEDNQHEDALPEVPSMNHELIIGTELVGSSLFGTEFDYFFNELTIEDLPLCDLSCVGLSDLPKIDFNITSADLSFIDDLLDLSGV